MGKLTVEPIGSEFIDFDFTQMEHGMLGCTPQRGLFLPQRFASFAEANIEIIPENQWQSRTEEMEADGTSLEELVTRIYNQKQEVSCTSNGSCQSHELNQAKAWGKDEVKHLSAIQLYRRVGSRNSGSSEYDNLEEMLTRGVLPIDGTPGFAHTHPENGYDVKPAAGWETTAAQFRYHEVYRLRSLAEFITCLIKRIPVLYGRDGHAICAVRTKWHQTKRLLMVKYVNSWGQWGEPGGDFDYGFGYDTLGKLRNSASAAFAVRSIRARDGQIIVAAA